MQLSLGLCGQSKGVSSLWPISLGESLGIFGISLPGQSVLARDSRSEDCAKRVRE